MLGRDKRPRSHGATGCRLQLEIKMAVPRHSQNLGKKILQSTLYYFSARALTIKFSSSFLSSCRNPMCVF